MASILLIKDDPNIRFTIEMALNDEGYRVISCDNGADGLNAALNIHPDLILLDLLLPELDGRDLLVQFKKNNSTTPVIVLTALSDNENRISCLDNGADDYLSKPFSIEELLARIRVCLRRVEAFSKKDESKVLSFGDMTIDLDGEVVKIKNEPVYLKRKEYALLVLLAQNKGTLVKRKALIQRIWGEGVPSGSNTIDAHIYGLRKALEPSDYDFITTEYGRGYRFDTSKKKKEKDE